MPAAEPVRTGTFGVGFRVWLGMIPSSFVALIVAALLGPTAVAVPAPHVTYAANRRATLREVRSLLGRSRIPQGSRRLSRAPKGLRRPAGAPGGAVIDRARFYRVELPFGQAGRWIRHHHPRGLALTEWGTGSRYGRVTDHEFAFGDQSSRAWTSGELLIEYVRGPHNSTLWRVDGMAQPLDPRPIRDTYRGHRTRITTDAGCPTTQRGLGDVRNSGAQLRHHLLPAARPVAVLLCSYNGLNGRHRLALRGHGRFGPRIAARLAHRVRSMSLAHVDGAEYSCPLDDGRADVVVFAFHGRPDVAILAHPRGCPSADNGIIVGGDPFGQAVQRLLHAKR